jgi:hypothetical protein
MHDPTDGSASAPGRMHRIACCLPGGTDGPSPRWEYLWGRELEDGTFEIDNIPFFVRGVSVGDRVSVVRHELGLLFRQLIASGGHSTLRVLLADGQEDQAGADPAITQLRQILRRLGCTSELCHVPGLLAVDVPPSAAVQQVRSFLQTGHERGLWDLEEACVRILTPHDQPDVSRRP